MKIDAKGKQCPIPMILAKRAIQEWNGKDGILQVFVDNEIAVQNLVKMAQQLQQEVTYKKHSDCEYELIFTMTNQPSMIPSQKKKKGCGSVVVIHSETMGNGDNGLGKILMKGFFYALTQLEILPQTILFYNGGAKLTCKSSECLEDIRILEEEGVEILTCGTCLDFYGLKNDLQIGLVTNMYDIVDKQSQAERIIHP